MYDAACRSLPADIAAGSVGCGHYRSIVQMVLCPLSFHALLMDQRGSRGREAAMADGQKPNFLFTSFLVGTQEIEIVILNVAPYLKGLLFNFIS